MEELIAAFSIDRVSKSPAKFDQSKVKWYNEHYLRAKPDAELAPYLLAALAEHGLACTPEKAVQIVGVMKERVSFPQDFWQEAKYFFQAPDSYDEAVMAKKWTPAVAAVLAEYGDLIASYAQDAGGEAFPPAEDLKVFLTEAVERHEMKIGQTLQALRVAVTGAGAGPDLFETLVVLGTGEVRARLGAAVAALGA